MHTSHASCAQTLGCPHCGASRGRRRRPALGRSPSSSSWQQAGATATPTTLECSPSTKTGWLLARPPPRAPALLHHSAPARPFFLGTWLCGSPWTMMPGARQRWTRAPMGAMQAWSSKWTPKRCTGGETSGPLAQEAGSVALAQAEQALSCGFRTRQPSTRWS